MTGHSYIVYGPLDNGTTGILYEGDPMHPAPDRHWEIIERYGVTQYYTAPTLIRAFIKAGAEQPAGHDLSLAAAAGAVGEPINPEAWVWYWKYIGGERCPIVDTWWQTETGGILISPLPGRHDRQAGLGDPAVPRSPAAIVDEQGNPVAPGSGGYLVITRPWPGMFRTLYEDDDRYVSNYFSKYGRSVVLRRRRRAAGRRRGLLAARPHRRRDERLRPPALDDRARVGAGRAPGGRRGRSDGGARPLTGQTPLCFVLLRAGCEPSDELAAELREWVGQKIGKIARPKAVIIVDDLPKTRSGKIMRRLLKDVAEGHELGDTTTLRDPAVVEDLKRQTDAVLRPGG